MSTSPCLTPPDAVAAATHDDPHAAYQALSACGLFFDRHLNCWVAASADTVSQALCCPALRVRPPAEPVPTALVDTPAATIFSRMLRMTDGPEHAPLKAAIQAVLDSVSEQEMLRSAREVAIRLHLPSPLSGSAITRFHYALPTVVLAEWFGIPQVYWHALIDDVLAFVRCIAPGGTSEEIASGSQVADRLTQRIRQQLTAPGPLLQQLIVAIEQSGLPDGTNRVLANAVGLLFQACEGCAGLMGQALLLAFQRKQQGSAAEWVESVLTDLPPIQNTRRFVASDVTLAGSPLHAGESLLAVLAGHDDASGQNFAFGHGIHACPGAYWARAIAVAGVEHLLQLGVDEQALSQLRWRRSLNARVPEFD